MKTAKLNREDVKVEVIYSSPPGRGLSPDYWRRFDRKVVSVKRLNDTGRYVVRYVRRGAGKVPFSGHECRCYADNFFRSAGPPVAG